MTLSLLLALGSCRTDRNPADGTQTDPNPDTEQTAAPESGEPETQTSYILVRSADAGIAERTLVRKLGNELAGVCKQLETRADDRLDGVTGTLILVGDTARQESRVTFRNSGSYTVRRVGGNLVIQGADELALDYACAAFAAYVRENGMQFPEGYCYDGQVGAGEDKLRSRRFPAAVTAFRPMARMTCRRLPEQTGCGLQPARRSTSSTRQPGSS